MEGDNNYHYFITNLHHCFFWKRTLSSYSFFEPMPTWWKLIWQTKRVTVLNKEPIYCICSLYIIKPIRCTNFTNLFWHETLHVSDNSSVQHQELIHCTLRNGVMSYRFVVSFRTGPGWNCSSILALFESWLQTCMTYTFPECTVN